MTTKPKRIPFDEFSHNLERIVDLVLTTEESVLVAKEDGRLVAVSPVSPAIPRPKTEEDYAAFLASAGSWSDVDTDALIKAIYASRSIASRPAVTL